MNRAGVTRWTRRRWCLGGVAMAAGSATASARAQTPAAERERARIERLLQAVERQATLTFEQKKKKERKKRK